MIGFTSPLRTEVCFESACAAGALPALAELSHSRSCHVASCWQLDGQTGHRAAELLYVYWSPLLYFRTRGGGPYNFGIAMCYQSNANEVSQPPSHRRRKYPSLPPAAGPSGGVRQPWRLVLVAVATLAVVASIELALVQGDPIVACLLFGWAAERNI